MFKYMKTTESINRPVRIAHIIGKLNAAGVEAVVNNYYKNIDHNKYQFDHYIDSDFLVSRYNSVSIAMINDILLFLFFAFYKNLIFSIFLHFKFNSKCR